MLEEATEHRERAVFREADDQRTIDCRAGDIFEVRLVEAAGSGYRWRIVEPVPGLVDVSGAESEPPSGSRASGGSREACWHCRPVAPGETTLAWAYGRSWERAPVRRFSLRVRIALGRTGGQCSESVKPPGAP